MALGPAGRGQMKQGEAVEVFLYSVQAVPMSKQEMPSKGYEQS